MSDLTKYAILFLGIWNIIVFAMYGVDKRKAKRGRRRISEKTLLLTAALMGGLGALTGMFAFRHKTKHAKFLVGVPLLLIINMAVIAGAVWGLGVLDKPVEYQKITPAEAKTMMDAGNITILDVRTAVEYGEGHIAGSILIPDTEIMEKAPELLPDKKETIIVYCRTGIRSARASHALIELGYTRVYDFGGTVDFSEYHGAIFFRSCGERITL